jgi:hypothetical protein
MSFAKLLPTNNITEGPIRNPGLYENSQFLFYTDLPSFVFSSDR